MFPLLSNYFLLYTSLIYCARHISYHIFLIIHIIYFIILSVDNLCSVISTRISYSLPNSSPYYCPICAFLLYLFMFHEFFIHGSWHFILCFLDHIRREVIFFVFHLLMIFRIFKSLHVHVVSLWSAYFSSFFNNCTRLLQMFLVVNFALNYS